LEDEIVEDELLHEDLSAPPCKEYKGLIYHGWDVDDWVSY